MASSLTEIANRALTIVGEGKRISSLDEDTIPAKLVKANIYDSRDVVFSEHDWKCLLRRTTLAPDVASPVYEYTYQFTLPVDVIRVIHIDQQEIYKPKKEGRKILCDISPIKMLYVSKVVDVTQYDPQLAETIAYHLAATIAFTQSKDSSRTETIFQLYQRQLQTAQEVDSQEGYAEDFVIDDWIAARL